MKKDVKSLTQENFDKYINQIIELAFREGVHWARAKQYITLKEGVEEAKKNIMNNECI